MTSLAVTVCATSKYTYAMKAQARHVVANLDGFPTGVVIFVTDESAASKSVAEYWKSILPEGWALTAIRLPHLTDNHANYKNDAQLLIAQLRTAAFTEARRIRAQQVWSLDSDVLPPPNALRCMADMLRFDGGYYSVSTCPYPSQSGTGFLGGRGTATQNISPDFHEDERSIPEELVARKAAHEELCKTGPGTKELFEAGRLLKEEIDRCPPMGNVFTCNAKKWRLRGWLDQAYPALGLGAVVPSDWCGFGCTLLSARALSLTHFEGYAGHGTEDLFIVWQRWTREGVRINVIPHAPCAHVVRKEGKFVLCQPHHEQEGDVRGHLRVTYRPWYQHEAGERYDEKNDGRLSSA